MTAPLDLDEIARRPLIFGGISITPAELAALVAAARGPEMPADVAGVIRELREKAEKATPGPWQATDVFLDGLTAGTYADISAGEEGASVAIVGNHSDEQQAHDAAYIAAASPDRILRFATLIESLDRQRQEAVEGQGVMFKHLNDLCTTHRERAEQAEKELADERDKLNTVRRCLADREEIAQKDAARLAKLEAVVTALEPQTEWHSSERDGGPDVGILFKIDDKRSVWCGEISKDLFVESDAESLGDDHGWFIVLYDETKPLGQQSNLVAKAADQERGNTIARLIAIALAALDRKEPKT